MPLDDLFAHAVDKVLELAGIVRSLRVERVFGAELVHVLLGAGVHVRVEFLGRDEGLDFVFVAVFGPGYLSGLGEAG
jgi:hypothetical protein